MHNYKSLLELPYPRKHIKASIDHGCSNRMESVRYSNFFCEWIKRTAQTSPNIHVQNAIKVANLNLPMLIMLEIVSRLSKSVLTDYQVCEIIMSC